MEDLKLCDLISSPSKRELAGTLEGAGKSLLITTNFYNSGHNYNMFTVMKNINSTPAIVVTTSSITEAIKAYNSIIV